jgi:hypothetical protein
VKKKQTHHQHPDVSTATQCRCAIAQPTRRPKYRCGARVETEHGCATIDGRIGQQHIDFIECCRLPSVAVAQGLDGADRYVCIVDPNKLRTAMTGKKRTLKGKPARVSLAAIKIIAEDLRVCRIRDLTIFRMPGWGVVTAGILDSVSFEGVGQVSGRSGKGNELIDRELWEVPFSKAWTKLIADDLPVSYGGRLADIVSLRHGVSQAVARFMLSHQPGASYSVTTALCAVGATDRSMMHHRMREIMDDVEALAEMGITLDAGYLTTGAPNHIPGAPKHIPGAPKHIPGAPKHIPGAIGL